MAHCFARRLDHPYAAALGRTRNVLQDAGFGIVEIDGAESMKQKPGAASRRQRLLGAYEVRLACENLQIEDNAGALTPCDVIAQEALTSTAEAAAIENPARSGPANHLRRLPEEAVEKLRDGAAFAVARGHPRGAVDLPIAS